MIRRPPRSTRVRSSAASDVYKRQGFLLHMLQPDDVLYDIGANIGTYTVIGSICGARVVAVEPAPETYSMLLDNIHLNRIETLVKAARVGLAASESTMAFSYGCLLYT